LMAQGEEAARRAEDRIQQSFYGRVELETGYRKVIQANQHVTSTLLKGDYAQAQRLLLDESHPAYDALLATVQRARRIKLEREAAERAAVETASSRRRVGIYVLVSGLMIGLGAVVWLLVRQLVASLRRMVEALRESATQMASAATQVSSSSQSLAQGANQQAASLEEISGSAEEINSMTRRNAENATRGVDLMKQAAAAVDNSNRRLEQMVASMAEIGASSDRIAKIIRVIDEIAFQTNILALNAAVEAARAGEAGMGFAVVADEVRNLAQRCARAAQDTAALIEESITRSNEGKRRVDEVVSAIRSITSSASGTAELVREVSQSSQEQARGIDEIARALAQMEQVTQRTASSAEQSAAAGEQLSAQSEVLRDVVSNLAGLVGGVGNALENLDQQVKEVA